MRVRFTIVLVVLLILIGGLVAVTQILRVPEDPSRGPDPYLYRSQDIVHVVISRGEDQIAFEKVENTWFINDEEGGEDIEVDIGRWGGIPTLLNRPAAATNLIKTGEDREQLGDRASYGLDPARTVITSTTANGQRVVVNIGNLTPTEDGYYISVEDPNDNLYIVHHSWVDVLERLLTEPPYPVEEG